MNFAMTSVKCTPILTSFHCYNEKYMTHKCKITPATSPLFCNLAKHASLRISMIYFRMCNVHGNVLKFTQDNVVLTL